MLAVVAIAALLPAFGAFRETRPQDNRRFAEAALSIQGLPDPVLPQLCRQLGGHAEPTLRSRLCGDAPAKGTPALQRMPQLLESAATRARQAFVEPLNEAEARLAALRLQQREGVGELLSLGDTIQLLENDLRPFVQRFTLGGPNDAGPMPLHCVRKMMDVEFALPGDTAPGSARHLARHNALLLFGAALDGRSATSVLAAISPLPVSPVPLSGCQILAEELSRLAVLMAQGRQATADTQKNEAMRALLETAGWQWAGWMLLGLGLVKLSRGTLPPAQGVALSLAVWALAAWIGRVPWPLAGDRAFVPGRGDAGWLSSPAAYVGGLLAAALVLLVWPRARGRRPAPAPQTMASRIGYAGLVLATGLGWALLLDLSAHGHMATRYLALYHQGHLWLGLLLFSTLLFLRQSLARALGWSLALLDDLVHSAVQGLGGARTKAALLLAVPALIGAIGLAMSNMRQLTSEIGRVWLIVGAAWFFFLRGSPLAEQLARSSGSLGSLLRYSWPLLFVGFVLLAWMIATRDMGPLLIAAYGAGTFLAAAAGMWWYQRRGRPVVAGALAIALFVAWIALLTAGLFQMGVMDGVTAARLESVATPLASANDQLALVTWFRQAAPAGGFGLGAVPWCGHATTGCSGVPLQIHSDYTFSALAGAFGAMGSWAIALAIALWLHRLIRHHGRVTRGEPRLVRSAAGVSNDDQAFLSWLCVTWVVLTLCQLSVTVAGNLAVLPLTGVTFPFVSFGMTSLLVNTVFLALCLNVNLPAGGRRG